MSAKTPRDKEEAKKMLEKRPVLVLFYMTGCPHCASNQPAWDEAKEKMKQTAPETEIVEIESENVPEEEGVQSFPTMVYKDKQGKSKRIEGSETSGGSILKKLTGGRMRGGVMDKNNYARWNAVLDRFERARTEKEQRNILDVDAFFDKLLEEAGIPRTDVTYQQMMDEAEDAAADGDIPRVTDALRGFLTYAYNYNMRPRAGGSRRRRVTRRAVHRRLRKLRHRTLRNNIALA